MPCYRKVRHRIPIASNGRLSCSHLSNHTKSWGTQLVRVHLTPPSGSEPLAAPSWLYHSCIHSPQQKLKGPSLCTPVFIQDSRSSKDFFLVHTEQSSAAHSPTGASKPTAKPPRPPPKPPAKATKATDGKHGASTSRRADGQQDGHAPMGDALCHEHTDAGPSHPPRPLSRLGLCGAHVCGAHA